MQLIRRAFAIQQERPIELCAAGTIRLSVAYSDVDGVEPPAALLNAPRSLPCNRAWLGAVVVDWYTTELC